MITSKVLIGQGGLDCVVGRQHKEVEKDGLDRDEDIIQGSFEDMCTVCIIGFTDAIEISVSFLWMVPEVVMVAVDALHGRCGSGVGEEVTDIH